MWMHFIEWRWQIVILDGEVNVQDYLKLLDEVIIHEGKRHIERNFTLQQDNALIHKANIVMNYLTKKDTKVLSLKQTRV